MPIDVVLDRLEHVRRSGSSWRAQCPAHDDRHPSLSISEGADGRILLHCFAGCSTEKVLDALGLELRDLFPEGEREGSVPSIERRAVQLVRVDGEPVDASAGLTVEALAEAKRLPVALLERLGVETVHYFGPPAVRIPYTDEAGEVVGTRYRLALAGDARFRWKNGTKAATLLYGANRLGDAREAGYVVLVEGETDAWTLIGHGYPVVALPGAGMWSELHAARLEGIEAIFVVVEPDKGGDTLLERLRSSVLRPRVRVLRLPAKDVSELHLHDEAAFATVFEQAMATAETLLELDEQSRHQRAAVEWERCRELALDPNILARFEQELHRRGYVGSLDTPKLVFLVLVSRLLLRPVSLVLRGLSSAGKSYAVESVLPFFPASAYINRSGLSDHALIYTDESFAHRILYMPEADAIAGEGQSAYFLRTLISENRLVYETTEKDGDRLVTRVIEKPGPTGTILTTTKLSLHPENETRMLALTVSDDPSLTRGIMRAIAVRDDDAHDQSPPEEWQALQSWLELSGTQRIVDADRFLLTLADLVPPVAVRLRRDFALIRSLVFTHALLHQARRERDERGRVIATLDDYAAIHALIHKIVAEGIGATVSDETRATVAAVAAALAKVAPETTVTRAQVQAELGLEDRATRRRLAAALQAGFILNQNPGRGKTGLYAIGDPIPDNITILPTASELRDALNPDNPDNLAPDARETHPPRSPGRSMLQPSEMTSRTPGHRQSDNDTSLDEALRIPAFVAALSTAGLLAPLLCRYPSHRDAGLDWLDRGGFPVCGVCHPPAAAPPARAGGAA